jgi:hypothetical protein
VQGFGGHPESTRPPQISLPTGCGGKTAAASGKSILEGLQYSTLLPNSQSSIICPMSSTCPAALRESCAFDKTVVRIARAMLWPEGMPNFFPRNRFRTPSSTGGLPSGSAEGGSFKSGHESRASILRDGFGPCPLGSPSGASTGNKICQRMVSRAGIGRPPIISLSETDMASEGNKGTLPTTPMPSPASLPPADAAAGNEDGLRGFRVPCLVIAPWARRGFVATDENDHTSILKMIELRWNLQPLTVRDDAAHNLTEVLDFSQQQLSAPIYPVPFGPFGTPCPSSGLMVQQEDEWLQLQSLAQSYGWSLPYKVTLSLIYH